MASSEPGSLARPLTGEVLDPAGERAFVLAEWTDDGSHPGEPIAPLHVHFEEDEAWYVLEGRLAFRLGEEEFDAPPGTPIFGPRGIPHTYSNPDPHPARYLLIMQPDTWSLLQALHGQPEVRGVDALFRAHGAELLKENA